MKIVSYLSQLTYCQCVTSSYLILFVNSETGQSARYYATGSYSGQFGLTPRQYTLHGNGSWRYKLTALKNSYVPVIYTAVD